MLLPASRSGGCCATVRRLLHSPTTDAARRLAFVPSQSRLASSHFSRHARPTGRTRDLHIFSLDCSRLTGHSTAIFEFAMSAEWFDNSLIVRHLANEETSAKGSQPYG